MYLSVDRKQRYALSLPEFWFPNYWKPPRLLKLMVQKLDDLIRLLGVVVALLDLLTFKIT